MESTKKYKIGLIGGTGAIGRVIVRWAAKDDRISELGLIVRKPLDEWS